MYSDLFLEKKDQGEFLTSTSIKDYFNLYYPDLLKSSVFYEYLEVMKYIDITYTKEVLKKREREQKKAAKKGKKR